MNGAIHTRYGRADALLAEAVGLNYRYNSDPAAGLKKGDALFVTGIAVKLD